MPRTALTVQTISLTGLTPAFVAGDAVNHHEFLNDGNAYLEVKNTSGSPVNVTIQTPAKMGGMDVTDLVVSIPATSGDKRIGPFSTRTFNQSGGLVYVDLASSSGITIGAFHLG